MGSTRIRQIVQPCIFGHFVPAYSHKKSRIMKWLSKLFKGSSHKVSDGRYPEIFGDENVVWNVPSSSMDDHTQAENEELDHAIALSLSEELRKPKGCSSSEENDEELARALQASLDMSSQQNPSYSPPHSLPRGYRLLTGSILAHELMHGWLRLNGFRSLSPEVEEGICQVLSHMWLESEVLAGSNNNVPSSSSSSEASSSSSSKKAGRSQFEKKLGEFFMHQIAMDSSTAYGEGFRAGNLAMVKYGLRSTLDHIRLTGNFPV